MQNNKIKKTCGTCSRFLNGAICTGPYYGEIFEENKDACDNWHISLEAYIELDKIKSQEKPSRDVQ